MQKALQFAFFVLLLGILNCNSILAGQDDLLRYSAGQSNPAPFDGTTDWNQNQAAISTGYYFVDSDDGAGDKWRPSPELIWKDLLINTTSWTRIVSGPNQFPPEHWEQNPAGHTYFRNPGDLKDSTDNAFAGPIHLGFPFHYNGVRYDSFYVSSNGLIALSNRRYFYDNNGNRIIPNGQTTAWDPQGDDTRPKVDEQNTNGINDQTPDDWGYQFVACGGNPELPSAGIRQPFNTNLTDDQIAAAGINKDAPVIAPFWDDWQLSQNHPQTGAKRDFGQVWFKNFGSELVIKFVQLMPIGRKNHPQTGRPDLQFSKDQLTGETGAFAINVQVTLSRRDSSVSVLYESVSPKQLIVNNRELSPWDIIRQNSTVGLRGKARYIDENDEQQRYTQYTEFIHNGDVFSASNILAKANVPQDFYAVKFKQHRNLLRIVDVDYLVPDPADGRYTIRIEDIEDYETLTNDTRLRSFLPVVTFQNMSNSIQGASGVNYRAEELSFVGRVQIRNAALGELLYSRQVCVDSIALANPESSRVRLVNAAGDELAFTGKGVPVYGFVEIQFPAALAPGQFRPSFLGQHILTAFADSLSCEKGPLGEEWPFDNSLSHRVHALGILEDFYDNGNEFHYIQNEGLLPSVNKWVSIGAEAADGDANTFNPPPPRGMVDAANNLFVSLNSPVIRLNRLARDGQDQAPNGDELRSWPIDLREHASAALSFTYQRTGIPPSGSYDRGWADQVLVGPEARVVQNGDWSTTVPIRKPDVLELHFANPSPNRFDNIVNIPEDGWSKHPILNRSGEFISDNPAFTVFGGGGYRRGFADENPDSALTRQQGLNHNQYDTGREPRFSKVVMEIPQYILDADNDGARYFRFKLAVKAQRNESGLGPVDDADDFYIDNVAITTPSETPDLEALAVRVVPNAHTGMPASQAENLQITTTLCNNSDIPSRAFAVQVLIAERYDPVMPLLYSRAQTLPFLRAKQTSEKAFPTWNSRRTRPGDYILCARMRIPGGDPNPLNDSTHGYYELDFTDAITVDRPSRIGVNSVPNFAARAGKGINLSAASSGAFQSGSPYGADGGSLPGQIALRFDLNTADTIRGYTAFFGGLNNEADEVRLALHLNVDGQPDTDPLPGSEVIRERGKFDLDAFGEPVSPNAERKFNTYGTYQLSNELLIDPGVYWLVVTQLESRGFELGGSDYRMGMATLNYATTPVLGAAGNSILNGYGLRESELVNPGRANRLNILYNNSTSGDDWIAFTPNVGNPAYAHLTHSGQVGSYRTYSRGSFVPMLRLYFGFRDFNDPPIYVDGVKPVELSRFDGLALPPRGIELFWETASEIDNAGFYVERRIAESNSEFKPIGFVNGAGSSTAPQEYGLLDKDVERKQRYEYRLRQVDFDGTASLSESVTLLYDYDLHVNVTNRPNPFTRSTDISFDVPQPSHVRLEIIDMLGNTVRILQDGELNAAARHILRWDTRDGSGRECAPGQYICRLNIAGKVHSHIVSLVK